MKQTGYQLSLDLRFNEYLISFQKYIKANEIHILLFTKL